MEHQTRLRHAFETATKHLEAAVAQHKEDHDQHVRNAPLQEGQFIYLKEVGVRGRHKIKDIWSSIVYKMWRAPAAGGSVYTIAHTMDDPQQIKHVHRSLLKCKADCVIDPFQRASSSRMVNGLCWSLNLLLHQ